MGMDLPDHAVPDAAAADATSAPNPSDGASGKTDFEPASAAEPPSPLVHDAAAPEAAAVAPAYVPRPKPPIHPVRTDDGHYRTDGILIERENGRSFFVTIQPAVGEPQRIYVHDHVFDRLLALATAPVWEQGKLWHALCDIPLERPLPNRRLEEELRAILSTYASELRA